MTDKKRGGFDLHETSKRKNQEGHSWFFGIGINQYLEFPDLNNAVKDVRDIKKVLVNKYELPEENTFLVLDEEAIEENIIDRFDQLAEDVKENDKLIIYYSGHGHLNEKTNLGYWIPHDAKKDKTSRYIRNSTIHEYIKVIKAKHILLISDSCFSGSLLMSGGNRSVNASIDELDSRPSRWAICSGRHDEEVYDGKPGENSPFAESILDTLLNNQKKALNVSKLSEVVMEQTRSNYQQLPEGSPLYGVGHKGGQYIFKMKADEKESWANALKLGTFGAYQDYVDNHPNGPNVEEARKKVKAFKDENAWNEAKKLNTISAYIKYDNAFPEGKYSKEAGEAIKTLEEDKLWQTATKKPTLYNYRNYIKTYPNGKYIEEAQKAMTNLLGEETQEGISELKKPTEYNTVKEEKPAVKEEKKNPFKDVKPYQPDVTADPFEKTDEPSSNNSKYIKIGAGLVGLLLLFFLISLFMQDEHMQASTFNAQLDGSDVKIDGQVTDLDKHILENVVVSVKGTTIKTVTESDGTFSLSFPKNSDFAWILFSKDGYVTHTVDMNLNELTTDGQQKNEMTLPGNSSIKSNAGNNEKMEWENLLANIDTQDFEDFQKKYPKSKFNAAARFFVSYFNDEEISPSNSCYETFNGRIENLTYLGTYDALNQIDAQIECLQTPNCSHIIFAPDQNAAIFYMYKANVGQEISGVFFKRICDIR